MQGNLDIYISDYRRINAKHDSIGRVATIKYIRNAHNCTLAEAAKVLDNAIEYVSEFDAWVEEAEELPEHEENAFEVWLKLTGKLG